MTVIPHPPYSPDLAPLWLFPLPQAEASDEDSKIRHHCRDSRGIAAGTWHNSKKGLPGMLPSIAETLGPLYSSKRGVLWRWWRNLTSKVSKLLFTSTVLELLDTSLYIHTYIHTYLSTYTRKYCLHRYRHTYVRTYIYTYICMYLRKHARTHTHTVRLVCENESEELVDALYDRWQSLYTPMKYQCSRRHCSYILREWKLRSSKKTRWLLHSSPITAQLNANG